jgi:TetR/AcrR family transcriptional regulator
VIGGRARARGDRARQILEALARELEVRPGERITTARLAEVVGVSEAALYRHFPSKARMFEGLIDFAEESVFGLANRIVAEDLPPAVRVERLLRMLLTFAERNPGITRILLGDAIVGERERLRERAAGFFERVEAQLRQILREAELERPVHVMPPAGALAALLVAVLEGRLARFVRNGFRRPPTDGWEQQWRILATGLFGEDGRGE